jgi:hypothetical protein
MKLSHFAQTIPVVFDLSASGLKVEDIQKGQNVTIEGTVRSCIPSQPSDQKAYVAILVTSVTLQECQDGIPGPKE